MHHARAEPLQPTLIFRNSAYFRKHKEPDSRLCGSVTVRDRAKLRTCPEPALWLWASFAEILGNNGEKKAGRCRH